MSTLRTTFLYMSLLWTCNTYLLKSFQTITEELTESAHVGIWYWYFTFVISIMIRSLNTKDLDSSQNEWNFNWIDSGQNEWDFYWLDSVKMNEIFIEISTSLYKKKRRQRQLSLKTHKAKINNMGLNNEDKSNFSFCMKDKKCSLTQSQFHFTAKIKFCD